MAEPDENPAAARLGEELRQLRIAAGYPTIQALAARIDGYGDSMLAKVEQGRRTASRQLFPAWLDACAVHIDTKAPVLTDGHRRALTALWELAAKREGPIPEFIELWLKREAAAAFLRMWSIILVPGLHPDRPGQGRLLGACRIFRYRDRGHDPRYAQDADGGGPDDG